MYDEPSEESVSSLMAMGICSGRDEAVAKLKAHDNDVGRAVAAIFDNPTAPPPETEGPSNEWDESQFHTDKGGYPSQNGPSFTINPPSNLQPNVFAPSRPPSRVSEQRPIDLTKEHAAADADKRLTTNDREEEDLRRAMELSINDLNPQESGVMNDYGTRFGPARQPQYDENQWALTTVSTTAHEIILDPEPDDRRRTEGKPVALRPSSSANQLSSLITTLHSIPMAREALLCRDHVLQDYGDDEEWWKGTPVEMMKIVNVPNGPVLMDGDELVIETQRLMAFLTGTERSYGSVEVVANLDGVKHPSLYEAVSNYMTLWREVVVARSSPHAQANIFQSAGVKLATSSGAEIARSDFTILRLQLDDEMASPDKTLYDAMDDMIWAGADADDDETVFIESIGHVFVVSLQRQDVSRPHREIQVPSVWYPDRYLEKSKDLAREMRARRAAAHGKIVEIEKQQAQMTTFRPSGGDTILNPTELLETAMGYLQNASRGRDNLGGKDMEMMANDTQPRRLDYSEVGDKLGKMYESVMSKVKALEDQKEAARRSLNELSTLLTDPVGQDEDTKKPRPKHRYTLRGVSTEPSVTYVLYPVDTSPRTDEDEDRPQQWQWWRISFSTTDVKAVMKTKVDEDLVLQAARDEGRSCLLIYASDEAMDDQWNGPLPDALKTFIHRDNLSFRAELSNSHPDSSLVAQPAYAPPSPPTSSQPVPGYPPPSPPRTSPKRKSHPSSSPTLSQRSATVGSSSPSSVTVGPPSDHEDLPEPDTLPDLDDDEPLMTDSRPITLPGDGPPKPLMQGKEWMRHVEMTERKSSSSDSMSGFGASSTTSEKGRIVGAALGRGRGSGEMREGKERRGKGEDEEMRDV
ncbi:MAG: hypothetical protein M1817_006448 [Caeruleum heppii]|nr:MAG: hypothetical protein M1817_006448 [Caeruleum heppii]